MLATNRSFSRLIIAACGLALFACQTETDPMAGYPYGQAPGQPQQTQPPPQDQTPPPAVTCPPAVNVGDPGYCTAQCPCETGQGACANDVDCKGGLVCADEQVGNAWRKVCKAPEQKNTDWQPCATDNECQSTRCGCSDQIRGSQTCLPANVAAISCESGEKKGYWENCGDHGECQSGRCGCWQGSPSQMQCLSTPVQVTNCLAPKQLKPLYAACNADHQCNSGVCGCSQAGQISMQCLSAGSQKVSCAAKRGDFSPCANDVECISGHCGCFLGVELPICVPAIIGAIACPKSPATKKDDWQGCGGDNECKSNKCGCYASTDQRCLPGSVVEQACTLPADRKPVGAACNYFEDCQTMICNCSATPTQQRVCLADIDDIQTCVGEVQPSPTPTPTCSNWGTSGDNGDSCTGVPAESWRCVPSTAKFPGANISQVCRNGAWVTFHINPINCSACCGAYSSACN